MMRVAILVMASTNPETLSHMIDTLDHRDISFFLHVDQKIAVDPFRHLADKPRTWLIESRHEIYWGGFNMVIAEIALIEAALIHKFDRYILVSDNSFPLKSSEGLLTHLEKDIQWIGFEVSPSNIYIRERYKNFYYLDSPATNRRGSWSMLGCLVDADKPSITDLAALICRGKKEIDTLFHGSQWWCLTAQAVEYLLHVHYTDEHLRNSFRFSEIPDEQYVQTIVGNAFDSDFVRNTHMWTDFSRETKPYVFTEVADLEPALASDFLFVRKVSAEPGFLNALVNRIREASPQPSAA